MPKLVFLPFLILVTACNDTTPVEPELGLSPEMTVAQAKDGMGDVVKLVPFKSTTTWEPGEGDPAACDHFKGDYPAVFASYPMFEGTATHMGRVTGSALNCIDRATFTLLTNSQELVAANGDKLFFGGSMGEGLVMVVNPDLSFDMQGITITGGTGRFENASGWLALSSESIYGGSGVLEGEISSVGSGK